MGAAMLVDQKCHICGTPFLSGGSIADMALSALIHLLYCDGGDDMPAAYNKWTGALIEARLHAETLQLLRDLEELLCGRVKDDMTKVEIISRAAAYIESVADVRPLKGGDL